MTSSASTRSAVRRPRARRAGHAPLRYRVRMRQLHAHVFDVELELDHPDPAGQELWLPVWIPGSYLVREFSRHVLQVRALGDGGELKVRKTAKNRWRVAPCGGRLRLSWSVYAHDASVRTAWLDPSRGFFNFSSLLLAAAGFEHLEHEVRIDPPPAPLRWSVATTLPARSVDDRGFGVYAAPDYQRLIDHPVSCGEQLRVDFRACGTPHAMVIEHASRLQGQVDERRLRQDLQRICEAQIALFEPETRRAPFRRYAFLLAPSPQGWGGLEHGDSSALICAETDLPHPRDGADPGPGYRRLLGLCSHEYFHAWNVKRIRPEALSPPDLQRENLTGLLWLFEGFTSYYDDLMLRRTGLISAEQYLQLLADAMCAVQATPGRHLQSLDEASFDAWIKFYRPDENTPNATVSYYTLGGLFALALDLHLRSRGKGSLDDVMRLLWQRYGRADAPLREQGVAEDALPALVREACGVDVRAWFARHVHGREELPLARLLAGVGVHCEHAAAEAPDALGLRLDGAGPWPQLRYVRTGSWAEQAGLCAGDVLVAVNDQQASQAALARQYRRSEPGQAWSAHAMRDGRLLHLQAPLPQAPAGPVKLRVAERPTARALGLRHAWLGS
ncbi:MAG: M61 family metallopeptidase [Betaproteobacteria bacterium]|nr:M61 family metallopeptidase [Betaproteobacteria bacterium]